MTTPTGETPHECISLGEQIRRFERSLTPKTSPLQFWDSGLVNWSWKEPQATLDPPTKEELAALERTATMTVYRQSPELMSTDPEEFTRRVTTLLRERALTSDTEPSSAS